MVGFLGVFCIEGERNIFSDLKTLCGDIGMGCAFVDGRYGILCHGMKELSEELIQPVTGRYNNALYAAAVSTPDSSRTENDAQALLGGYIEEGEEYIHRLDIRYSLAMYDGRCGELLLAKGFRGDRPLFYTVTDKAVYFSTTLRPLMRLFGGTVRVDEKILTEYIGGGYSSMPDGLFCDISPLSAGHILLCSSFGVSDIAMLPCAYPLEEKHTAVERLPLCESGHGMRNYLAEALYAFGYPQFDHLMPSLISRAKEAAERGEGEIFISDGTFGHNGRYLSYSAERACRIGNLYGVEITPVPTQVRVGSKRLLKAMEKELDALLCSYLDMGGIPCVPLLKKELERLSTEKSMPLRIRKKGILCQTAMWLEGYHVVLV